MFDDIFANFPNPFDLEHHDPATLVNDWNTQHTDWIMPSGGVEIGDPLNDAAHWQQQQGDASCAVVAQAGVYESITGQPLSEADACRIAEAYHLFDPTTGTPPEDVGKLLEVLGIPTQQYHDATLVDIAHALESGDKVIVGVDANEIWNPIYDPATGQSIEQPEAGHAVWVTGIDEKPDGSIKIILNDSGTPDGQMKEVDAQDFLNAWSDFGNFMVVADAPQASVTV